jgi:hypothetical protein
LLQAIDPARVPKHFRPAVQCLVCQAFVRKRLCCCRLKRHLVQHGIASVSIYADRIGHSRRPAYAGHHYVCRLGGPKRDYLYCTRLENGATRGWENHIKQVGDSMSPRLDWGLRAGFRFQLEATRQVLAFETGSTLEDHPPLRRHTRSRWPAAISPHSAACNPLRRAHI